ncbi:MAG: tRNA (N6-threonylcarbamoyladenosine(37)-N6)-methyltransferase TrmO [Clostridia bacterium]|nr:tRNA (N6-threonylcarbamoyladenosine(37)-N6)-methyltransferase TrmO [Clostridia bacterium]
MNKSDLKIIARIKTDFPTKFGIPRQSGLIPELQGKIIFEPEYRKPEALRGIDGYSHLWLLWDFSEVSAENWSPTVRPPRLGGNKRMGVFATRSPYRPNPIGLSSVKLEKITEDPKLGTILHISGADLMNGTPIYDIKPYIAYTDSHPDATGGFSDDVFENTLSVDFPDNLKNQLSEMQINALLKILESDPRPAYKADGDRIYSFEFGDFNIKFSVNQNILTVLSVEKI